MKKLICWLFGHKWDLVHGYRNAPDFGAICDRCATVAETYDEWMERTGQNE